MFFVGKFYRVFYVATSYKIQVNTAGTQNIQISLLGIFLVEIGKFPCRFNFFFVLLHTNTCLMA